jgi:hypothetical protein
MKFITGSAVALFIMLCVSTGVEAANYLLVEEPLAKIYRELDPKSPLIKQVKKGEYLDLVYEGTTWHKVKVDGQEGWIERRSGIIVDKQGGRHVLSVVFFILVAAGSLGGVGYYIFKARTSSSTMALEGDEL